MNTITLEMYLSADKKVKATLRAQLAAAKDAAVRDGRFEDAQRLMGLQDEIKASSASTSGSTFDVHAEASNLAATYEAAALWLRLNGANQPGEVITKRYESLAKLPTRKTDRGSVVAWIESVVTDEPAKLSELLSRWVATSDYPDGPPSSGAIGAAYDRAEAGAEYGFDAVRVNGAKAVVAN